MIDEITTKKLLFPKKIDFDVNLTQILISL